MLLYLLRIRSTAVSREEFLHSIRAFLASLSEKPIDPKVLRRLLSGIISFDFGVSFFSCSFLISYFFSSNFFNSFSGGFILSAYFKQFFRILYMLGSLKLLFWTSSNSFWYCTNSYSFFRPFFKLISLTWKTMFSLFRMQTLSTSSSSTMR